MDLSKAIKYPFLDKDWIVKNLILLACYVFVVTIPAAMGYAYQAARVATSNEDDARLPEWSDFGNLYVDGLRLMVMQTVYILPAALCFLFSIVGLTAASVADCDGAGFGLFAGTSLLVILLGIVLALAGSILAAVGYVLMMAEPGSWGAGLRLGHVLSIFQKNWKDFLTFFVLLIVVTMICSLVSSVTFGIGAMVVTPISMLTVAYLYGKLYNRVLVKEL